MAAPAFVAASTGGTDATGGWTATCHAPGAADRIIIFTYFIDGQTGVDATITSTTNIKDLAGTSGAWTTVGKWVGGNPSFDCGLYIRIGRSTGTSAPVVTGANVSGDDVYYRFYEFQNVNTGSLITDVIENVTAGTGGIVTQKNTDGTILDSSVTTLGPDRLALNFVGINDDNAVAAFTGQTGGTWAEAVAEYADATGTDACIQLQTAAMATAGTIDGGTTSNVDATDEWVSVGFALIGTTVAVAAPFQPGFVNFNDPGVL